MNNIEHLKYNVVRKKMCNQQHTAQYITKAAA